MAVGMTISNLIGRKLTHETLREMWRLARATPETKYTFVQGNKKAIWKRKQRFNAALDLIQKYADHKQKSIDQAIAHIWGWANFLKRRTMISFGQCVLENAVDFMAMPPTTRL